MKKNLKKLGLSRETLRNLTENRLGQAVGAQSRIVCTISICGDCGRDQTYGTCASGDVFSCGTCLLATCGCNTDNTCVTCINPGPTTPC
jgi:hypothetical protein